MKSIFAFLTMVFVAFSAQAVYLNWSLPNSQYIGQPVAGGTGETIADWTADIDRILVYSSSKPYDNAADVVAAGTSGGTTAIFGAKKTFTFSGGGEGISIDIGTPTSNEYYYLVVFKANSSDADYVVSQAVQYTGTGSNGFQSVGVDPESTPDIGTFFEPSWMGGTWRAPQTAPEPTALALLALGAAGLALRRRVA